MAENDPAPQAPAQAGSADTRKYMPMGRDKLARLVVVGSFLTLFLLVLTLIFIAEAGSKEAGDTAKNAFTAVLPVLAGWVGTVLAFYFSSASQERTSDSLDRALGRHGQGAASAQVATKMIPYGKIKGIIKLEDSGNAPQQIELTRLQEAFKQQLDDGGTITRLLFVEKGVFRYVMHIGALNAYIVKAGGVAGKTFADMLADEEMLRQISRLVAFVASNATLAEAKAALDKVNGAQDIIVTGSGMSTEPMAGWLSNVDLTKALEVT